MIRSFPRLFRGTTPLSSSYKDQLKCFALNKALDTAADSHMWSQAPTGRGAPANPLHQQNINVNTSTHPTPLKYDPALFFAAGALNDPLDDWLLSSTVSRPLSAFLPNDVRTIGCDPFDLVSSEMASLSDEIMQLLGSDHPVLEQVARYFFELDSGKKVRPVMVLLMSHALSYDKGKLEEKMPPVPNQYTAASAYSASPILETQRRLAEIAEMIHTASLFHDDVIDKSDVRRGVPSINKAFGNKLAILAGDFLLARASICLARLRDIEVVEVMSSIIEHLVKGEVMQMKVLRLSESDSGNTAVMEYYLKKNFYKTASLMANSCMSTAILGGSSPTQVEAAYLYGKHIGCAFQLIDDVLDFEGGIASTGKPALADLQLGISTAPVLFAAEEFPVLYEMIERKFEGPGDIDVAVDVINKSAGLARTKVLAQVHAEKAVEAVMKLPESEYRDALVHLAHKVLIRKN